MRRKSKHMGLLTVPYFLFDCDTLIGFSLSLIKLVPKTESVIGLSRWKISLKK